jgi:hypothetical protein
MFCSSDKGWMLRHGLGLVCAALVLAFTALHALVPHAYLFFTRIPDGAAKLQPFVDLRAILQGGMCWRQGVDVYRPSACLWGGVFNYSPLLLRAAYLPIGPEDTLVGGLLFCAAYAVALSALPPPRSWKEWRLYAACACSPVAYYALEQGNLDALIFALTVLALRLPWRWRAGAYAIFTAGAAAKFYPASLFILALRENRRFLLLLAGAGGIALVLALALYGPDLLSALVQLPSGTPFRASFGRIDLPRGLAMLHYWPRTHTQLDGWALALLAFCAATWRRPTWHAALGRLKEDEALFLVAGAAVISFCFMTAQNIEYRAIFLLLTLPALVRLAGWRAELRPLPWVVALLLWEAVPRAVLAGLIQPYYPTPLTLSFWLLREALWWWLMVELLGALLAFAAQKLTLLAGTHIGHARTQPQPTGPDHDR